MTHERHNDDRVCQVGRLTPTVPTAHASHHRLFGSGLFIFYTSSYSRQTLDEGSPRRSLPAEKAGVSPENNTVPSLNNPSPPDGPQACHPNPKGGLAQNGIVNPVCLIPEVPRPHPLAPAPL